MRCSIKQRKAKLKPTPGPGVAAASDQEIEKRIKQAREDQKLAQSAKDYLNSKYIPLYDELRAYADRYPAGECDLDGTDRKRIRDASPGATDSVARREREAAVRKHFASDSDKKYSAVIGQFDPAVQEQLTIQPQPPRGRTATDPIVLDHLYPVDRIIKDYSKELKRLKDDSRVAAVNITENLYFVGTAVNSSRGNKEYAALGATISYLGHTYHLVADWVKYMEMLESQAMVKVKEKIDALLADDKNLDQKRNPSCDPAAPKK